MANKKDNRSALEAIGSIPIVRADGSMMEIPTCSATQRSSRGVFGGVDGNEYTTYFRKHSANASYVNGIIKKAFEKKEGGDSE
tara:strand:- start:206 stop:454 length:249 start_codon:yes stop_codon:yes gene_type:complete